MEFIDPALLSYCESITSPEDTLLKKNHARNPSQGIDATNDLRTPAGKNVGIICENDPT